MHVCVCAVHSSVIVTDLPSPGGADEEYGEVDDCIAGSCVNLHVGCTTDRNL